MPRRPAAYREQIIALARAAGRVTNSAKPLPVQHTGPAAISLAGIFRFCTTVPCRDLNRPACGATLKKSTKADH